MSNNRAHLSMPVEVQKVAPPSPQMRLPCNPLVFLPSSRTTAGPSGPPPEYQPLSRVASRARARTHPRVSTGTQFTHIYIHTHTNVEGKCFSAPFRLCLTRDALENQYRETRKQRQGVDSNLCAGSIPVPLPLLAVPFSRCVSLLLCIPLTLSQFLSSALYLPPFSLSLSLLLSPSSIRFPVPYSFFTCHRS